MFYISFRKYREEKTKINSRFSYQNANSLYRYVNSSHNSTAVENEPSNNLFSKLIKGKLTLHKMPVTFYPQPNP